MINPTKMFLPQPKPMLKVKTHLKAGQGCADPDRAYNDGYNAGYNESRDKGSKRGSNHYDRRDNNDWWN
jgi:hypothetical protein